jgi:hypothetical protein
MTRVATDLELAVLILALRDAGAAFCSVGRSTVSKSSYPAHRLPAPQGLPSRQQPSDEQRPIRRKQTEQALLRVIDDPLRLNLSAMANLPECLPLASESRNKD